jgi:hypothetical protein
MRPRTTWHLRRDHQIARREDGWSVARSGEAYWLLPPTADGVVQPLLSATLDDAVSLVDELHPPSGWQLEGGAWLSDVWHVRPVGEDWAVFTPEGDRVVRGVHKRAHEAREWADVRRDRAGRALRGPIRT